MKENQYDCSKCNYRDRSINFCGFCTKKLLKEIKEATLTGNILSQTMKLITSFAEEKVVPKADLGYTQDLSADLNEQTE